VNCLYKKYRVIEIMTDKPERNDPCHCGSGRKYKNCCIEKDDSQLMSKLGIVAVVVAIILGLVALSMVMSDGNSGIPDCPAGTEWSEAHQHCH